MMNQHQLETFIARYIAMWNERDAGLRHTLASELWAADAENITRSFTAAGWEQILQRVDKAHAEWVARLNFIFRPAGRSDSHNNLVRFHWEMVPGAGGPVEARGLDILVFDNAGKIRFLYQFPDAAPS